MIVFDMGSWLRQWLGVEYSSLSSAAGCESLAEKTIGSCIGSIVMLSSYIAVMRDAKLRWHCYGTRFYDFRKKSEPTFTRWSEE